MATISYEVYKILEEKPGKEKADKFENWRKSKRIKAYTKGGYNMLVKLE